MIPEEVDSLSHHLLGRKYCTTFKVVLKQMVAAVAKSLQQAAAAGLFIYQVLSSLLSTAALSCSAESKRDRNAASSPGTYSECYGSNWSSYYLAYVTHYTMMLCITVNCRANLPALEEVRFQVHTWSYSFECNHCLHFS